MQALKYTLVQPKLRVAYKKKDLFYRSEYEQINNQLEQSLVGPALNFLYKVFYNPYGNTISRQVAIDIASKRGYKHMAQGFVREVLEGRFAK
jgi:hypothetical protein